MHFKECVKASKTKMANRRAINRASRIEVVVAKVIKKVAPKNKVLKKVIPKNETLEDKSSSGKSREGCILAQNLTPEEESTKRPIKINVGGTSANSRRGKMNAKLRSRRSTLDWWKCYLDSCA